MAEKKKMQQPTIANQRAGREDAGRCAGAWVDRALRTGAKRVGCGFTSAVFPTLSPLSMRANSDVPCFKMACPFSTTKNLSDGSPRAKRVSPRINVRWVITCTQQAPRPHKGIDKDNTIGGDGKGHRNASPPSDASGGGTSACVVICLAPTPTCRPTHARKAHTARTRTLTRTRTHTSAHRATGVPTCTIS